jgi:hypothetical protein
MRGSLASCGRLAIGRTQRVPPRLHRTAAVANRRTGSLPAPHYARGSTLVSHTQTGRFHYGRLRFHFPHYLSFPGVQSHVGFGVVGTAGNQFRRPAAELSSALRPHRVNHGQDGVEVVVLDLPIDFARSFPASYPEFPDSCLLFDLPSLVNVFYAMSTRIHREVP